MIFVRHAVQICGEGVNQMSSDSYYIGRYEGYKKGYLKAKKEYQPQGIPYTESDRKAIEDEVWKLADTIHGMSIQDKTSCFGFSLTSAVTLNFSYQEAKAKYEAWKKKGVIHVGDEIMSVEDDAKAVMLDC